MREADSFYTGQQWEIGVAELIPGEKGTLHVCIHALSEQDKEKLYLQTWPEMEEGKACRIEKVETSALMRLSCQAFL